GGLHGREGGGLPGVAGFVLREAAGDLAGPRLRGLLHAIGLRASEVAHDQTERAADRRVRLDVPAEARGAPADPEPARDRSVDDDDRRGAAGAARRGADAEVG